MPIPSIKTLTTRMQLTVQQAKMVRKALKITAKEIEEVFFTNTGLEDFPKTRTWIRQCYHTPKVAEVRMAAADEHAGTHGVEVIYRSEADRDDWRSGPALTYLNAGDTYANTLIRYGANSYRVGAWGDWVERHPNAV